MPAEPVQIEFPWIVSQSRDPVPPNRVAMRTASRRSSRRDSGGEAMPYTVAEAAKAIGKSKAAVFRAIRKGTVTATRDESSGMFLIDSAELHRAFSPAPTVSPDTTLDTAGDVSRFAELHGRLADAHETIDDLRRRLDQADADRRQALDRLAAAQERIAALLTDQRAPAAPQPEPETARRRRWWWRQ
jgi:hypothetical protein